MKKSQLGNGNVTSKSLQANKENGEQEIAKRMAAIITRVPGGRAWLFQEFFNRFEKRRREAKRHNEPIPMLLRDVTDLTGAWQLALFLRDERLSVWRQGEGEETALSTFFTNNAEARHLMIKILMNMRPVIFAKLRKTELTDPSAMKSAIRLIEYLKEVENFHRRTKRKHGRKITAKISRK